MDSTISTIHLSPVINREKLRKIRFLLLRIYEFGETTDLRKKFKIQRWERISGSNQGHNQRIWVIPYMFPKGRGSKQKFREKVSGFPIQSYRIPNDVECRAV